MADRALRLRLGLFMGVSLILLAGLVVLFGGAPQLFSTDAKYTILYPEAPGIGPGIPIRKSGVRIGQVTAMELDPESGQVRVRITVDRKYLPRRSEEAHITRGLLSGDTAVDFLPKELAPGQPMPRGEEWPPGSEIPGVAPLTPRSVINQASLAQAQESLLKITRTFERFEQTAGNLERTRVHRRTEEDEPEVPEPARSRRAPAAAQGRTGDADRIPGRGTAPTR
jgi:phospholipid/cholesterol/gamma-HCH transport system substrate-binding protein